MFGVIYQVMWLPESSKDGGVHRCSGSKVGCHWSKVWLKHKIEFLISISDIHTANKTLVCFFPGLRLHRESL